jgi:ribosome maturation factor RimP
VGEPTFLFGEIVQMSHPLVPQILDLAAPIATSLGLEVVAAVFHTHQRPPVLRVDVQNRQADTSLEDCERMSRAFDTALDQTALIAEAYVLEISSPGLSRSLTSDREFISFRGFAATVTASEAYQGQREWTGSLIRRDQVAVYLNQKGRTLSIPRHLVTKVQLVEGQE